MKTILLADNDSTLRTIVELELSRPDLRILKARSGLQALDLLRQSDVDVAILNWIMPEMSGIEVAESLADNPATNRIPVVMLTSRNQTADQERSRNAGVFAYLVKPFSLLELFTTIEAALGLSPGAESTGARPGVAR